MDMKPIESNNDAFLIKAKEYLEKMGILNGSFSQTDVDMFLTYCKELKLNPFMNEVYAFITQDQNGKQQLKTVISYHKYLQWAEESDKLDGWEYEFIGSGDDLCCVVTIYRKDWNRPFKHRVYLEDCGIIVKKDGTKISRFKKGLERYMLMKTAISQAFRLCFPTHMKSLPYTREEMLFYNDEANNNDKDNGNGNGNNNIIISDKTNNDIIIKTTDKVQMNNELWINDETGDVYPFIEHPDVIKCCYYAIFEKEKAREILNKLSKKNKNLYKAIVKCIKNENNKIEFIDELKVFNNNELLVHEFKKLNNNNNYNNNNEEENGTEIKSNQSN
jgi:hypothetical protein